MLKFIIAFALSLAAVFWLRRLQRGAPGESPAEAFAQAERGEAVIIDVREASEWADGVAQPAHLLPLSDLRGTRAQWTPFLEANKGKILHLYCQSGMRSSLAARQLRAEGWDARNLGAYRFWPQASLPIRHPIQPYEEASPPRSVFAGRDWSRLPASPVDSTPSISEERDAR